MENIEIRREGTWIVLREIETPIGKFRNQVGGVFDKLDRRGIAIIGGHTFDRQTQELDGTFSRKGFHFKVYGVPPGFEFNSLFHPLGVASVGDQEE